MFACHNLGRMRGSVGTYTNLADNRIFIVVPKESPRGRAKASRGGGGGWILTTGGESG